MSKQQAKDIFKDGVTTWEEKTMHEYTDIVYGDIEKTKDYVVDSNRNINGGWRKWASGLMECWGTVAGITDKNGGMALVFVQKFIEPPIDLIVSERWKSQYNWMGTPYGETQTGFSMKCMHGNGTLMGAGESLSVTYLAVGKWK